MNGLQRWLKVVTRDQVYLAAGWCHDRAKETQHTVQPAVERAWAGIYEDNGSCVDIFDETPPELSRNVLVLKVCDDPVYRHSPLTSIRRRILSH
jgi:hypothetical protein